jgi:hypothetical protein
MAIHGVLFLGVLNLQLRTCGELEHLYATAVLTSLHNRSHLLFVFHWEPQLGGSTQRPGRRRKMCVTATADMDAVDTAEETVLCTRTITNEVDQKLYLLTLHFLF